MRSLKALLFIWWVVRVARGGETLALEDEIEVSIDAGVGHLLRTVEARGWTPAEAYPSGYAALQVYALVKCDVSFQHPLVQKGLAAMESYPFEKVYSVSLLLMAYGGVLEQIDSYGDRAKVLMRMEEALQWLLAARLKGAGAWYYEGPQPGKKSPDPRRSRYDNSNTQFAVLALGVAAEAKLKVPEAVWEEIVEHFVTTQGAQGELVEARPVFRGESSPGPTKARPAARTPPLYPEKVEVRARGWRYDKGDRGPITFSMTCAGMSSLLLAQKYLSASWTAGPKGDGLRRALRDGYGWTTAYLTNAGQSPRPNALYYDLYSLEKVGDVGGVVSFGGHHWYDEGARRLIRAQRKDGGWGGGKDEAVSRHSTALALLFLSRATDLSGRSRPLTRVTPAGGAANAPGQNAAPRPAWLYLPSQKAEVPLARLFRLLRNRPTKQVIAMVEEAAKVQDPERLSDLVRPLCAVVRASSFEVSRSLARKLLAQMTGLEAPDPERYEAWAARWEEVASIGAAAKKGEAARLRGWLAAAEGAPLKRKVIWALERTGAREALGDIIDLLEAPQPELRERAYSAAVFLSGASLPFHPQGDERTRGEEVRAWRAWLAAQPR